MKYEFNPDKYITKENESDEAVEVKESIEDYIIKPTLKTCEERLSLGERPTMKRTQEDLDNIKVLNYLAMDVMHRRVLGKTEFDVTVKQYEQFKVDLVEATKLYTWGYCDIESFMDWVDEAINVELAE